MDTTDKRYFSLFSKSLKSCVEPMLRPVFKAQGAAASQVISQWQHIVGKEMAEHCQPLKLTFAKDKNSLGTLTIACEGAHALVLQHMQPMIIERIASYFGYKAVASITIVQRRIKPAASKKAPLKTVKNLDHACIAKVEDEDLKKALSSLAKTIGGPTLSTRE